jgi:hypothetical protein
MLVNPANRSRHLSVSSQFLTIINGEKFKINAPVLINRDYKFDWVSCIEWTSEVNSPTGERLHIRIIDPISGEELHLDAWIRFRH